MNISISSNRLTINGNIKTVLDYQNIKTALEELSFNNKVIIIDIKDSISITSSVIGYLNKLVLKDNIDISIYVGNDELRDLFDDLNLTSLFKVKRG